MFVNSKPGTEDASFIGLGCVMLQEQGGFTILTVCSFSRTLIEPRQAEIRKECLQLWGVRKLPSREVVTVGLLS